MPFSRFNIILLIISSLSEICKSSCTPIIAYIPNSPFLYPIMDVKEYKRHLKEISMQNGIEFIDGEDVIIQNRFLLSGYTKNAPGDPGDGTIRNPIGGGGPAVFTPGTGDNPGAGACSGRCIPIFFRISCREPCRWDSTSTNNSHHIIENLEV